MTLMFLLAPSTRFGYFIYPAALAIWLFAVRGGRLDAGGARYARSRWACCQLAYHCAHHCR